MYEAFFNLEFKPFELLPDPRFIFLSRSHKKAMTYMDYGIRERSGFILLTGEIGSGKTTLIKKLLDGRSDQIVLAMVFNTRVSSDQLLAMINDDFGLATEGKNKITLMRELNDFLVETYAKGKQAILIIDEAQNLSTDLLEEVRMLSNLETTKSKLLQIILVGQPELRTTLAAPELNQLRQRIGINCHLQALNREEMQQYIAHRLKIAGNESAVAFLPEAMDMIYHYSKGIPRLINLICDFLLLCAFADEQRTITVEMIEEVVGDLGFNELTWHSATEQQPSTAHPGDTTPPANQNSSVPLQGGESQVPDRAWRVETTGNRMDIPIRTASTAVDDYPASPQKTVTPLSGAAVIHKPDSPQ